MVNCPLCNQPVDWVTKSQAAKLLDVSDVRVSQFIKEGRLPGAQKKQPANGISELWCIPIDSLMALINMRRKDQGLQVYVSQ